VQGPITPTTLIQATTSTQTRRRIEETTLQGGWPPTMHSHRGSRVGTVKCLLGAQIDA
jgi:hypothetical protein